MRADIGLDFCCGDLRSVGATVRSRPIPAGRLAGCSSALGHSGPVAVAAQRAATACIIYVT